MFYDGFYGASLGAAAWTSLNTSYSTATVGGVAKTSVFHPNTSATGYNSLGPGAALVSADGGMRRDFPLPVYYRGGYLVDEDDTFLVDLLPKE